MTTPYRSERARVYAYHSGDHLQAQSRAEIFQAFADTGGWQGEESVSGIGSSLAQTAVIRQELPEILAQLDVKRLLDLPCGDFHWLQELDLGDISYTGADLVASLVQRNQRRYGNNRRQFVQLDLLQDDLGQHDLLFCRDCLVHLSLADAQQALLNIRRSNIRYLMMTTFPEEPGNEAIATGGWRPLNFSLAPFSLPEPLLMLNEGCTEANGLFPDKSLAVWRIADLEK